MSVHRVVMSLLAGLLLLLLPTTLSAQSVTRVGATADAYHGYDAGSASRLIRISSSRSSPARTSFIADRTAAASEATITAPRARKPAPTPLYYPIQTPPARPVATTTNPRSGSDAQSAEQVEPAPAQWERVGTIDAPQPMSAADTVTTGPRIYRPEDANGARYVTRAYDDADVQRRAQLATYRYATPYHAPRSRSHVGVSVGHYRHHGHHRYRSRHHSRVGIHTAWTWPIYRTHWRHHYPYWRHYGYYRPRHCGWHAYPRWRHHHGSHVSISIGFGFRF